jgi:hypothetical protein
MGRERLCHSKDQLKQTSLEGRSGKRDRDLGVGREIAHLIDSYKGVGLRQGSDPHYEHAKCSGQIMPTHNHVVIR